MALLNLFSPTTALAQKRQLITAEETATARGAKQLEILRQMYALTVHGVYGTDVPRDADTILRARAGECKNYFRFLLPPLWRRHGA
jgi:hypothetical protein